ncbi:DNA methylase [uncultured Flavonifractor sp.]|nr:DNA methylase [uncultured Flavonifractor sp.]
MSASKEEIKDFYERNTDNATRTEYIKGIFNNDYTRLTLSDGRLVGYKTFQNVLHLWEGEYENRTAQSFYDWGVIAQHFEAMRLLRELTDTMKPLPSMDGQLTLIMGNQAEVQKTSAFTFSQEIIDAVLTRGSGVSEGKMRIYEQFEKSLSAKENADFLKNEYGWGGSYPVIIGAGIDEQHDGKGITISKGIGSDKPHITLSWSQVEKRIGDLIRMDRYLNPKEKEKYPEWLEKQEERRAELAEQRKNREILSTAPPEPENKEVEPEAKYEYHLGDSVYIGASQYEILSFDENRVMLYDLDMPLFNKELSREEFDRKVRENPMNDHLKVSVLPAEEKAVTGENEAQNDTETVQDFSSKTGYDDAFFIDRDNESVAWMYYNPDSNAGGQYVTNTLSFDEIQQAAREYDSAEDFFDYLGSIANQELADVGTEWFVDANREFHRTPDLTDCTSATMKALIKNAERTDMVATNIGNVPIEDYREIVATQNGFDSYEEMYNEGVRIGNGYDKEPEPIVPAWEQKKKSKVKSFDLHPDIPMSERHNFDLANNQVEEVNKKERFHRNYAAIKVLKDCQNENRFATPDEQKILSRYVGWGGIPEAFDERAGAWHTEYAMLKNILTPEEYASARESTLTAFYTPPEVSTAIYKVLEQMGFQEGNLLEPSCGIGNFIGMLPKSMENAKVYGVELDTISAGIAQQLYQKSSIAAQGFEEVNVPDSFFDGVIGNVPFGDFKVSDKRYDKYNFLIHDYFFAKSLDKLRPGGVMALVTSKGTMDKENSNVRKYIAQRAELLGAIRLPNDTFKGNAGTEVVSDILFLQKRDRLIDIEPDWVHLDTDENGIRMNSYFVQHPEMILGEMKMVSGRFGPEATCEPFENADLSELLNEAVSNIHGEISEYEVADELEEEDNSIPADPTVRNFSYTVLDDRIYFRENSRMSPVEVSATAENRIKGMIGIRDCVRNLIELQTEDYPDSEIKQAQEKLNTLYDGFTKKYGLINSRANTSAFSDDSSYALLSALEVINEDGELERKADMFFKRTIKPHKPVTEVDTADEALAVSMGEKAAIDMEYMMELSGKSEEELFADLKGVIFLNPLYEYGNSYEPKYLMADEYLSGNVREKLATAKRSAALYPEDYTVSVQALEKVQPKDLTASEISVRLGATWIPPEIFQQFMFEFLDTPRYAQWNIKVHYSQFTGEWNIEGKSYDRSNVKAYSTYGTSRINAYKIIEETLNLKDVRIFDYIEDEEGRKKAVLNKKETAIAQAKQELIKQGFQDWIWADPARREKLTKMYNEKFNSIRPREYDGSHIVFNGMNPEIELREHQKNAVAHILYGGNTLLAHAVGAGKTFEMVAAAMESKRLGLCNKSLFVVPNHLTEQWAAEFLQLYPAANILVATKRDFETKNRKKFCGRIATGDYDAVIIGHSQFEKIPMSIERQRAILEQQLEELTDGIMDLKRNRGENFSIKQLEKSKKSVKQKLEKLNDQSRKDDVVTFEELGVDRLFIDESHYYKNLYLYTKMRNVGGIAQTEAQKSSDLFMKCRYLDELTGGRGTVFATGTPISNSMVELYTIQRYLQYNTLVKNNLQHFDSWASTFGETVTAVELTPEGTGYRAKTRFAKFYNLPELMAMFKEVADIKTADMLELPVPEAHFHNVAVKPSEMQKEMVASLAERAEKVRGGGVDSSVDNMLKITNDGRKLALDQRMLNDMLPDFEGSKINACVDNIYRIWEETADKKSAQLVFCDLSTPKNDGTFSVYNDIRKKLIERGVPESEVRFIHEADTDVKKKELFQKTRKGEVRVLLGSTQKMGAGTNVQDRLIALHDVDCPWRPSDLEQRSGRIIRQGNSNPDVDIYRYVTEQTFDAYLYQLVEGKQKFASQIMTSKSPVRSAEDIDETALSYAEIKMLATGNPYIKEKMDLDIQVQKLKLLKSNFLSERYALEDKIIKYYPQRITALENRIEGLKQDVETAKQHPKPTDDRFVGMEVKGVFYSEKADAGKAIIEACKQMNSPDPIPLGKYRGFETELLFNTAERNYEVRLKGATSRNVPLGDDAHGNIIRLDNGIERFAESLSLAENDLENTTNQLETAKKEVQKPFIGEEELKTKLARLDELNILLNMDKRENEIVGGEPDEGEVPNTRKEKTYER